MAISFGTFFARAGKAFHAVNTLLTAEGATVEDEVEDFAELFATPIEQQSVVSGVYPALEAWQGAGPSLIGALTLAVQQYLVELVKADNPQPDESPLTAVKELIRQMEAASESVDASAVAASVAYASGNVGTGAVVVSVKRADGRTNEHCLAETIECDILDTAALSFTANGEGAVDINSHLWPDGSGATATLTVHEGASGENLLANGGFEDEDSTVEHVPEGWIASVATLGTTLKLSDVEVQTVAISGTPTGGYYLLHFTNSSGKVQTTAPLAYNASGGDVQTALRSLVGLEDVTVSTSGTSPDYTHTITFTGVPNPGQLTSTSGLTGGTPAINHATTTAGSAHVIRGARSVEFDSNGSQLTTINVPVSLDALAQYAACVWMKTDSAPAAGVITIDLVDGIGGAVINDDAGTANSYTVDCTALTTSFVAKTGVFRTPANLPSTVYFRIRISTAISNTSSVFLDEACLVPMTQLYAGGPSAAAFQGPVTWEKDDRATITVTNDRGGALHEHMNRAFALRDNDLLLPSNLAGGETQLDSLIG